MSILVSSNPEIGKLKRDIKTNKDFFLKIIERYPEIERFQDFLFYNIGRTDVTKLSIEPLKYGSAVSLPGRIVFSSNTLKLSLIDFLFNLFHELAHHHQFKKYGYEKMIKLYQDGTSIEESIELLYEIEIIADEFATRKLREMVKKGLLIPNQKIPTGYYKTTSKDTFKSIIEMVREMIKNIDYKNTKELGEKLYDLIRG